jgi:tetratricopeptide (TPR) repeat protein
VPARQACSVVATLVGLVAAPPAAGQATATEEQEARTLFERGVEALGQERFADALRAFQAAYRLDPRPMLLYNIGLCQRELGDPVAARATLVRYLEQAGPEGPADLGEAAREVLAGLDALLGTIAVDVDQAGARVFVDGAEAGVAPLPEPLRVAPGAHTITAQLAGFESAEQTVTVGAGESLAAALTLRPSPPPLPLPAPDDGGVPSSGWFWASVGIGGAATVAAIVTGSLGLQARSDFLDGGSVDLELHDRIVTLGLTTDVLIGVAGAGAAAALILFLAGGSSDEDSAAAEPSTLSLGPGTLVVAW